MKTRMGTLSIALALVAGCQQATAETTANDTMAPPTAPAVSKAEPAPSAPEEPVEEAVEVAAASETTRSGDGVDGKAVFVELDCVGCHTAAAGGIAADKKKMDLPGSGGTYEPTWMKAYLLKEQKISGRAHPTKMEGAEAKQNALVEWICSLKK